MTLIECPKCKHQVDIDATSVTKEQDGLDLIVTCPRCKTPFILQKVALVRQKLLVAKYGFAKTKSGRTRKVKVGGADADCRSNFA